MHKKRCFLRYALEKKNLESEAMKLYMEWNLSNHAILVLSECCINSIEILKMIHSHDIDEIFNTRQLIGDKIKFRYNLQKWRIQNKFESLTCTDNSTTSINTAVEHFPNNSFVEKEPQIDPPNLDVRKILSKTLAGNDILTKFEYKKHLTEIDQTAIVRIIVDHYLYKEHSMDSVTMKNVAKEIIEVFPSENESTYYIPRGRNKRPSGKLYDRYLNAKYKRKLKTLRNHSEKKSRKSTENTNKHTDSTPEYNDFQTKKQFLLYNTPSDIEILWKETSFLRMQENKDSWTNFINDWPRYKDPNGYELIKIDFETIHPGKYNKLFEKIQDFEQKMDKVFFSSGIKDKLNYQNYQEMKLKDISKDSRHFHFFNLLHTVIPPPRINKNTKPSIADAQLDMISLITNLENFKQEDNDLAELTINENLTVYPQVLVIGESVQTINEFFVSISGIRYKVPNLLSAIDLIMKIYFVFNLNYSKTSKYVLMFLQELIYEIPCEENIPKIKNCITRLKNFK
ncbi:uncharacterized protein LOC129612599 [Condylostylus longicornis]|uniref:uncharacterized protein LOC129612599 n=1 Tax=Condylostylus longicornis TaxID=2530218 RepID=UPI00244DA8C8|nr:uncharacterized protein LOC129612599 [Condylostylus longicornis]